MGYSTWLEEGNLTMYLLARLYVAGVKNGALPMIGFAGLVYPTRLKPASQG